MQTANIIEQTLSINIDLPDEFLKVSSDDEIDIGRKLDKANLLLKIGFDNLNIDLNKGFNDLTTMMYENNTRLEAHNKSLEAILEKLANK